MYKPGDFSLLPKGYNEMMTEIYNKFVSNDELWEYLKKQDTEYNMMDDKYVIGHTFDLEFPHSGSTMRQCLTDIMYIATQGWDRYIETCF